MEMTPEELHDSHIQQLLDYVIEVSAGAHDSICPLNHHAYRNKWCNRCEATKLIKKIKTDLFGEKRLDLSAAHRIVAGWPKWKQELAEKILRPSFSQDD